MKPEGHLQPVS